MPLRAVHYQWLYTDYNYNIIRIFLESESDKDFVASLQELRLRFSGFVANLINSYPRGTGFVQRTLIRISLTGEKRLRLFAPNMRFSLFFLFSTWCGYFGSMSEYDTRLVDLFVRRSYHILPIIH